ncbi:MAG: RHS repeat domain-containing protein [Gemmatimonadaceae bacterium]
MRDAAGSQPAFNEEVTHNLKLLVVNERTSPIARGWTVAGFQRVYPQSGRGVLITEGDGSAVFFTGNCSAPCTYTAPSEGEFTRLRTLSSGGIVTYLREYPDSTKAWFRSAGLLDSIADPFGNTTRFEYDGSSRLTKVYDPARTYNGGASRSYIALTYGTYGLSQIQEPGPDGSPTGGRVTLVTVESDSTLRAFIDPDNDSTRFAYDASRRLETVVSRRGTDTTKYAYGTQSWKLIKTTLPRIPIDAGGGTTVDSTPVITYQPWHTVGVPTAATSSAARAAPAKQDSILAKVIDAAGRTTSMTVDRWGQPLKVTDPLGRVTTIERVGPFPQSITHPTGAVDRMLYSGHQLQWTKPAGQDTTYFQYGAYDRVIQVWGPAQPAQHFKTGVNGRVDSVRVGTSSYTTHYRYDTRGRVTTVIDPGADTVKYHYDDTFGNLDSTLAPGSRYTRIRFDGYGRDSTIRAAGSPTVTTLYDVLNRVKEVRDSANASPTKYTYDQLFLTRVQDPKNQVYRFEVNRLGWKTREYDPADTLNRYLSYRYNPAGLLTSTTNRRGQRVDLTYDAVSRLISKRGPANVVADSFAYATGTFGARMLAYNAVSRDSVFTSPLGWVDSVVTRLATDSTKRFRIRYRPDAMPRLDSIGMEPVGAITFPMRRFYWSSGTGLLDSLRVGDKLVTFGRGDEGQRTTTTWEGSLTRTETHTRLHQGSTVSYNNTTVDAALWRGYGYDSLARLSEVDRKNGSGYKVRLFGYTGVGQLRRVEDASLTSGTSGCPGTQAMDDYGNACIGESGLSSEQVTFYSYDHVGNLTQEENVTTSTTTQGTLTTGNRLTQWGATPYTYDLDGNLAQKRSGSDSVQYHWSADGRLDSVITSGLRVHYEYNALGQLARKRRNGSADRHLLWDQGHLLAELDGTLAARVAEYAYYPGTDRPLALLTGATTVNNTRYVQQDELGSVAGITTLTAVSQQLDYDPWGKVTSTTGTLADTSRLRWKALPWEGDSTQLYYVRNRWYDPVTKRFVSEDPIGLAGGINRYVYGSNDPVNRFDPLGLSDCVAVNVVIVDLVDGKLVETPDKVTICGGAGSTIGQILDYAATQRVGAGSAFWGGGVFATPAALESQARGGSPSLLGLAGRVSALDGCPKGPKSFEVPGTLGLIPVTWQGTARRILYFGGTLGFEELGIYRMVVRADTPHRAMYVGLAQVECAGGEVIFGGLRR